MESILAAGLLAIALASPCSAKLTGRAADGAALARDACSACHQVSPSQKPPPPVFDLDQEARIAAPSFMTIARDPRKDAAYLRKVITLPHYPMKEQVFDDEDLDGIITYILSLRPERP